MIMYDSDTNAAFPPGAAYAAYVDGGLGDQPNYQAVKALFPAAHVMSIALFPDHDADCLDMEKGAAASTDFPWWYRRQRARGITRPVAYASASPMGQFVLPVLAGAGIARATVRLWTAHTGAGAHICGPATCGELPVSADATQWTFTAVGHLGLMLDMSLLLDNFFETPVASPVPTWQEHMMQALPTIQQGAKGPDVKTVQGLCNARIAGLNLVLDGTFGPITVFAVKEVQKATRLAQDGIVGPRTWPALLGIVA